MSAPEALSGSFGSNANAVKQFKRRPPNAMGEVLRGSEKSEA